MVFLKLFLIFFKIGLFAFGGGLAMLPLIQEEVVENNQWLTEQEFIDLVAIAQSTPGPIAVNAATFIGQKTGGILGGVFATAGVVMPSIIIMFIIASFFFIFANNKYVKEALAWIKPGTIGFIASAVWFIGYKTLVDWKSLLIFLGVLTLSFYKKPNPIIITIVTGVIGILIF
jgi:chromate transporter